MKLTSDKSRDRRALALLGAAVLLVVIYVSTSSGPRIPPTVSSKPMSIPAAELLLGKMRQSVALVPGKDEVLKAAVAELGTREKGLIVADTANQAQEQLLQIVRKIAAAGSPPVEIKGAELGQPHSFGDAYGEVTISLNFDCRMEQLVQMLADLSARPELVASRDLRVSGSNPKQKTVSVRLTVSGIVPKKLVPEKKEGIL